MHYEHTRCPAFCPTINQLRRGNPHPDRARRLLAQAPPPCRHARSSRTIAGATLATKRSAHTPSMKPYRNHVHLLTHLNTLHGDTHLLWLSTDCTDLHVTPPRIHIYTYMDISGWQGVSLQRRTMLESRLRELLLFRRRRYPIPSTISMLA